MLGNSVRERCEKGDHNGCRRRGLTRNDQRFGSLERLNVEDDRAARSVRAVSSAPTLHLYLRLWRFDG